MNGVDTSRRRAVPRGCDLVPTPQGRLILGAKRFIAPHPDSVADLLGSGSTIVCLNPARELMEWPEYIDWLTANQPDRAIWYSMPDWNAPGLDEVQPLLDMIVERLTAGRAVVVHCSHGQGRTGTIAVALLMIFGHDRDAAEQLVALHRPGAGPTPGTQTRLIAELEAQLAR